MAIDLTEYTDAVGAALAQGHPCVLATAGEDGRPDIGPKGSVLVLDKHRLAYWERTRGAHLENVRRSPEVAVLFLDLQHGKYIRFFGRAELHEQGALREQVMQRVVKPELDYDPERKGIAVVIEVDRVLEPFGRGEMTRD